MVPNAEINDDNNCLGSGSPCGNPSSILGLDTMLRIASEARVDSRLRRYYLIVLLLPNVFALACLPLSSI